jgi:hypothetical protein
MSGAIWDMERSLYLRALTNMIDIMDRMHLEMDGRPLTQEADAHYRHGVARFHQAMVMVTKSVRYRSGKVIDVPFVIHQAGSA